MYQIIDDKRKWRPAGNSISANKIVGQSEELLAVQNEFQELQYDNTVGALVLKIVALLERVEISELKNTSRGKADICLARQMAMYLMHTVFHALTTASPAFSTGTEPPFPMPANLLRTCGITNLSTRVLKPWKTCWYQQGHFMRSWKGVRPMDVKSDRDMVTKSASSKNAVVTKESIRLLKLLSSAAKNTCLIERGDACLHLVTSNRKVLFEEQILKHCLAHGLISLTQSSISLTEIGSAYLKRQLFPNTAFQAQHSEFIHKTLSRPDGSDTVLLNTSESPILRLHTRKNAKGEAWLGDKEFQAGERLRSDFEKAQMQPRISANWVSTVSNKTNHQNSSANLSDFALDCRNRVNAAINSLDSELAGVCLDICCYLKGLELVEKERGWPPRSAKLMLRTALRQLARHYGLTTVNRHSKVAAWGMEGYRPSV